MAGGSRPGPPGASAGAAWTACAACKYQRRKCTPECPLSPYFPADQPKRFANVHKLFGVSNILRLLKHVDPAKRKHAVKSIAYEADAREQDPVHGCLGVITVLQNQVAKLHEELQAAREQLFLVEQHSLAQQQQQDQSQLPSPFHAHNWHGSPFGDEDILDSKMPFYGPSFGPESVKAEQARAGSYFGIPEPAFDESPVSHHHMHTLAALDLDPSFHLRSNSGGCAFDLKQGSGNSNSNSNSGGFGFGAAGGGGGLQQGHDLRRAGVYLTLTNQH